MLASSTQPWGWSTCSTQRSSISCGGHMMARVTALCSTLFSPLCAPSRPTQVGKGCYKYLNIGGCVLARISWRQRPPPPACRAAPASAWPCRGPSPPPPCRLQGDKQGRKGGGEGVRPGEGKVAALLGRVESNGADPWRRCYFSPACAARHLPPASRSLLKDSLCDHPSARVRPACLHHSCYP